MNQQVILLLIIGHLIGDFFLQTEKMVSWKQKDLKGAAFHGMLVALTMQVILLPFYPQFSGLVFIQGLTHVLIDWWKVRFSVSIFSWEIISFLLDQLMHLGVILVSVHLLFAAKGIPQPVQIIDETILYVIITYLLATAFAAIFLQILVNYFFPAVPGQPFLSWQNRIIGLSERVVVTTAVFYGSLTLLVIGFLITPLAYYFRYFEEEDAKRIGLRYILSILWALFSGLILRIIT